MLDKLVSSLNLSQTSVAAMTTAEAVKYTILSFLWLDYLWASYLDIRQVEQPPASACNKTIFQFRKCKSTEAVPAELAAIVNNYALEKARAACLEQLKVDFAINTFAIVFNTTIICRKLLALSWAYVESIAPEKSEIAASCLWVFLLTTLNMIVQLPVALYSTFRVAKQHKSTKQTVARFIKGQLAAYVYGEALELSFAAAAVAIFGVIGSWVFFLLWIVTVFFLVVTRDICPGVIAAYTEYRFLPACELRTEIQRAAASVGFPLAEVYVCRGMQHGDGFVISVCGEKAIVVCDGLLPRQDGRGFQVDEVVAILVHEMGHWKHHHSRVHGVLLHVNLAVTCLAFHLCIHYDAKIYEAVGFPPRAKPLIVGLLVTMQYVLLPYVTLTALLSKTISRHQEYQADAFCKGTQRGEALKRGLVKMYQDSLIVPVNDNLYSFWHHDHPNLLKRLKRLE